MDHEVDRQQVQLWALRAVWFLGPLVGGLPLRTELAGLDTPGRWLIEVALWAGWFVAIVASLTPHPVSLTIGRLLAPSVVGVGLLFGLDGFTSGLVVTVGYGIVLTALSLAPSIGDVMVNGSAYGSERRMALRTPAVAYLGPIPLAWSAVFIGLIGWSVALDRWGPLGGLPAAVAGAGLVYVGSKVLYQLARRWIVFVPAGFVIHDPFQLAEPVLLPRAAIDRLGPAEILPQTRTVDESSERLDLSAGSLGLALEVETTDPITLGVLRNRDVHAAKTSKLVFSPSLPGALLSEARIRGIKIKGSSGAD